MDIIHTTEPTINTNISEILDSMKNSWTVMGEQIGAISDSRRRPDIVVSELGLPTIVIENETNDQNVDRDAMRKLGVTINNQTVKIVIGLLSPNVLRNYSGQELREQIGHVNFRYALYTKFDSNSGGGGERQYNAKINRWPETGFVDGDINDLAEFISYCQMSALPTKTYVEIIERSIKDVSQELNHYPEVVANISNILHQQETEQTVRMAMTIELSALIFHETISPHYGKIPSIGKLMSTDARIQLPFPQRLIDTWNVILDEINYWPIFDIARSLLEEIPIEQSSPIIKKLADVALDLIQKGMSAAHDLTGAIFQQMISDRDFLAANYTRPESAALLTCMALQNTNQQLHQEPCSDDNEGLKYLQNQLTKLRVADLSCGTGTLLVYSYKRLAMLYEHAGLHVDTLHPTIMQSVILGCDVLPSAVHLTASALAGLYPGIKFDHTELHLAKYGIIDKIPHLGALDLLEGATLISDHFLGRDSRLTGSGERDTASSMRASISHNSVDYIVMNPPFTRPTNHTRATAMVINPAVAAFVMSDDDQRVLGHKLSQLGNNTVGNGYAGLGSYFVALADLKLKRGGTLALILPSTILSGSSWQDMRQHIANHYNNIFVISISAHSSKEMSFSSDTDMAEIILIATKDNSTDPLPVTNKRGIFVTLNRAPNSANESIILAKQILKHDCIAKLESQPVGGSQITFGDDVVGSMLSAPMTRPYWQCGQIRDLSLAQFLYHLEQGIVKDFRGGSSYTIPITTMGSLLSSINLSKRTSRRGSNLGVAHRTIKSKFHLQTIDNTTRPAFPCLWSHDRRRETKLIVQPDTELIVKDTTNNGMKYVNNMWRSTSSKICFNYTFRYNSQQLCVAYLTKLVLGGRSWPNINLRSPEHAKVISIWCNSTFGLLVHWWMASRSQSGRGSLTRTAAIDMPIIDPDGLSNEQINSIKQIFDRVKDRELLRVNEICNDDTRMYIDHHLSKVLGLHDFDIGLLRQKFAVEPGIVGDHSESLNDDHDPDD